MCLNLRSLSLDTLGNSADRVDVLGYSLLDFEFQILMQEENFVKEINGGFNENSRPLK